MSGIKLTEVEKAGIYGRFSRLVGRSKVAIGYHTLGDMVAKAQLAKVHDWGEERCPHRDRGITRKRECGQCWDSLKEGEK